MRAVVVSLTLVFAATVYAGEEPGEPDIPNKLDGQIIDIETGQATDDNSTDVRPVKKELQKQSVKMIVGGQSTDGVAKEIVVSPEQ